MTHEIDLYINKSETVMVSNPNTQLSRIHVERWWRRVEVEVWLFGIGIGIFTPASNPPTTCSRISKSLKNIQNVQNERWTFFSLLFQIAVLSRLAQRTCLLMLTKFDKCIQMSMNHQVCFSRYVSFRNPFSAVATWIFRSRFSVGSAQTELLRAPAGTAGLRWGSGARASRRSLRGRSPPPHEGGEWIVPFENGWFCKFLEI